MKKITVYVIALFLPLLVSAQTVLPPTLSVQGNAQKTVVADKLNLSIDVFEKAKEYDECYASLQKKYEILKTELKKEGIDIGKLRTQNMRINEDIEYTQDGAKKRGYEAGLNLVYEDVYSNEIIHKLIVTLNKSTLGYRYNVSFLLSDEKIKQYRKELMSQAVIDATEKATILTNAAKIQLSTIYSITYSDGGVIERPMYMQKTAMLSARESDTSAPMELTPGNIELRESVSMVWLIK